MYTRGRVKTLVLTLGHRFIGLDVEREVVGSDVGVVEGSRAADLSAVAPFAQAMILAVSRRRHAARRSASAGSWTTQVMIGARRFASQTLGLTGRGRSGRHVARKVRVFGMPVLVADPCLVPEVFAHDSLEVTSLGVPLAESRFVSLHRPLTPDTERHIGQVALARMKPNAWLVNASRGGLSADTSLDVRPKDPPPPKRPVLDHERAIVASHVACYSSLRRRAAETIACVVRGGWPEVVLNDVSGAVAKGATP